MLRVAFAGAGAYMVYPLYDNKITIHHADTPENRDLIQSVPSLSQGAFYPTPWLSSGSLQTIYGIGAKILNEKLEVLSGPNYDREILTLECGGTISIDWVHSENLKPDSKVLIIVPGLTGGSEAYYIQDLVHLAQSKGFRVAVFHGRGISGTPLTTPRANHLGLPSDLDFAVNTIHSRYPEAHLVGLGTSMGANLILKYAGELGNECLLKGISVISAPFDVVSCSRHLRANYSLASISDRYLTKGLTDLVRSHTNFHDHWEKLGIDINSTMEATRTFEFDKTFTVKVLGYQNPEEYYDEFSCHNVLHNITVPVLALSSRDDPVVASECIPFSSFNSNPNLILALTRSGGHVGWFTGMRTPVRWYSYPTLEFLDTILEKTK
ncbi:unnamed protein product [Blepharisma stoltei]|uniref:AB hydrolase-1 domain-containing protein n=1 Tax=Blepharisma stoltei TaxID=1481888 RepID=A0AAU9JXE5_9CILI|nr:unnamed protein product [Blepharisma stoltei]